MSSTLYAVCTSLTDFFERFERFVDSLEGKVRVSLGSIGESSTRTSITPGELGEHERYQVYKSEALEGGAALLTTVAVEQDARSLEFRLSEWRDCLLPVHFDPKMVNRTWLSRLSSCFELRSEMESAEQADGSGRSDRHSDVAYLHAVQHFEESAAVVNRTSRETASATRAFLADATRQFTQLKATFESGLESELSERREMFERYLNESDGFDVRAHTAVRRELLDHLQEMTDEAVGQYESVHTGSARRRVSRLCGVLMVFGLALIAYGLGGPLLGSKLAGFQVAETPDGDPIQWPLTEGNEPAVVCASGAATFVGGLLIWLVHTLRVQRRWEAHDETLFRFRRDLLRMSWVSELFLEALDKRRGDDEEQTPVPQVLLDRFSRSLFLDDAEPIPGRKGNGQPPHRSSAEKPGRFVDEKFASRGYGDPGVDGAPGKRDPVLKKSS